MTITTPRASAAEAAAKHASHPRPGRASRGRATSSVIWRREGVPSIHRGRRPRRGGKTLMGSDLVPIANVRTGTELTEHVIVTRVVPPLHEIALGIEGIAEHDGLRGTALLASRLDVAVGQGASRLLGRELALLHALDAQAALLH